MLYIEFELNNLKLKFVNYELFYWYHKNRNSKMKNPYWRLKKLSLSRGYLITRINKRNFLFSRIIYYAHNPDWDIYDCSPNNQIDHKDRNPLNNNISNLRVVNNQQNSLNRDVIEYAKGYYFHKQKQKYHAEITLNYKKIHLGLFDTEIAASNKYQKVRLFVKVLRNIYKNR